MFVARLQAHPAAVVLARRAAGRTTMFRARIRTERAAGAFLRHYVAPAANADAGLRQMLMDGGMLFGGREADVHGKVAARLATGEILAGFLPVSTPIDAPQAAPARPMAQAVAAPASPADPGVPVRLPGGSTVPDPTAPGGLLMSPVPDLRPVAAEGRRVGDTYVGMLRSPDASGGAILYLMMELGENVGQGGRFDYQRSGSWFSGFVQRRQFRNVSNFNVGLFCRQAGLTRSETLDISGTFAVLFSSNRRWHQPHFLDPQTAAFIARGWDAANTGAYGPAAGLSAP